MATEQIAVRLPREVVAALDDLVARGVYESRAAAVRAGIEAVLELDRRHLTDQAIVAGYRRIPPSEAERQAAVSSLRDAILEEPWWPSRDAAKSGGLRSKLSGDGRSS